MGRRRGRTGAQSDCTHGKHHPPRIDPDGTVHLDWSTHQVGRSAKCRRCARYTLLRDCSGDPIHKVCAERELADDIRIAVAERARADPPAA